MKFTELQLSENLLEAIEVLGFEEMTPIQEKTIPLILENKDLIACAQTGTGKTAAFLIPIIERLTQKESEYSRALILVPTRELAMQIDQNIDALSYYTGVSSVPIIGGKNMDQWDQQKFGIENGADVLIATPGRFLMHIALGYVNFDHIEVVVLDEADKMLDMGFYADIIKIISQTPETRQTLMFSATMPPRIRELAQEILKDPAEVNINISKPAAGIKQLAYSVYREQKIPLLEHIIAERDVESMIIFASSKASVDEITRKLKKLNYEVEAIHSDKSQDERQETLRAFKNKQFRILVGTDVLARGIDIDNLSHVLNFDVPMDAEDYVHRVGRTARASNTGEAITFITPRDQRRFADIEALIEMEVPKGEVPEELGPTPAYSPGRRRSSGGGRRDGGKRGGGRGRDRGHKGPKNRGGGKRRGRGGPTRTNGAENRGRGGAGEDQKQKAGGKSRNRRRKRRSSRPKQQPES
ncbi:MAG: DEAD/DEAH box helicase [Bacteroidetes bacterium]|nr:MAG: DEAD/DEAH box helicase [Bacteroidota bacterium]